MAIRKNKKKAKVVKLIKPVSSENEFPKKSIQKKEDKQLFWFFAVIGIVFIMFLIPYFWMESLKSFEYGSIEWMIEDYDNLRIYHGIFMALNGENLNYNIFLRGDPRENDVLTEGTFTNFKYGGVVSMAPEIDNCRGELSRVMLDLGAFLKQGVGVGSLATGSTDELVANESNRRFARCDNVFDRTVVVIEFGNPSVVQDEGNPYCYTVYAEDCNDISSVERFIVKTVDDFTRAKKALEESGKAE